MRGSRIKLAIFILGLGIAISIIAREHIFRTLSLLLLVDDFPNPPADIVLVLRGGSGYERIISAYQAYRNGLVRKICIPRSLGDVAPLVVEGKKIVLPSGQELCLNILRQLGVPDTDIILDLQIPGGGSRGEAIRIKRCVDSMKGVDHVLIITSWYHTRRARLIYNRVFSGSGIKVSIQPAMHFAKTTADNWWQYRYETVRVAEEMIKLLLAYLNLNYRFSDDPPDPFDTRLLPMDPDSYCRDATS